MREGFVMWCVGRYRVDTPGAHTVSTAPIPVSTGGGAIENQPDTRRFFDSLDQITP